MSVQLSTGTRCLSWGLGLHLVPYFVHASSEVEGEIARMRSLALAFAVRLCGKLSTKISHAGQYMYILADLTYKLQKRASHCSWSLV